jgi:hypothetical protein
MQKTTQTTRIATIVRSLPKLVPSPAKKADKTLITIRHTSLPEPRKLMAGDAIELGFRSGISCRIGGAEGFRRIAAIGGRTIRLHVGDITLATANRILTRLNS